MHQKLGNRITDVNDQQVLAKMLTLLALERNYLEEERTSMAEFRDGLTLTVIGLPQVQLLHFLSVFALY
jgi:uncharacterized membrane protein YidH (DUF202 family)